MTSTTRRAASGGTAPAPAPRSVVVLRALLATWRDYDEKSAWYQGWFLPSVVADHVAAARSDVERELLTDLHAAMTEPQWRA
ncbi:MAG TPA: hypothetical protein VN041_01035, partial [Microbacterium sp.]|nr:hypothetical protein [Microbacterium sp.]